MKFKYITILLVSFLFSNGCNDDNKKEVSVFVGNYVISEAKLTSDLVLPTVETGDFTVAAGTDITSTIQTALLNAITCNSASDSYVELREDNSMFFSCKGADPINAGTWEELSSTSLKLNMNATALPPIGFSLTVTDIVTDANGIAGKTIIPMPSTKIAGVITPLTLSPASPVVFIIYISIKFIKK